MSGPLTRSEHLKGARVGPYEIKGLLGHGATASVFEGVNVDLGRRVALKILHEHLASDARVRSRFQREGKIAAQLRHPNAVAVLDVGTDSGLSYLVMELLEGRDLRALLEAEGTLSVQAALALLLPVASALGHAHALGAIHRDVKPGNVVLARFLRGELRPKLVDFGLSKLEEDDGFLTSSDLVMGTAEYMAPETTLGTKYASPQSDQYSLAAVLYECLTGRPPIQADSFVRLIEAIRAGGVRPPSELQKSVPEGVDAVVLRALHRNPENRYPSVRAFGRALLPFADPPTVAVYERDSRIRRRRHRRAPAALRSRGPRAPRSPAPPPASPSCDPCRAPPARAPSASRACRTGASCTS